MDPYALNIDDLTALLDDQPPYRARQVRSWLARGVDDPLQMTDLPLALRRRLAASFEPPARVLRHVDADGGLTHKLLLGLGHDAEPVESVLMLYPRTAERRHARATVCVSTQAGCAMACPFCATGQAGLRRQLSVGEIVRQVTAMQRLLAGGRLGTAVPDHVTGVVFMGMGEPLANLDATVAAVRWLTDAEGFGLSARSITVSTVGLIPGIRRLAGLDLPITLAVSLHAPNDELRNRLVPINRQHPLADLLDTCRAFHQANGRRLTFEYILIAGVNDDLTLARQLAALVGGLGAHVNLIPMNPTPGIDWRAPAVDRQRAFAAVLAGAGVATTIRANRGQSIEAACGQLYADHRVGSGRTLRLVAG